MVQFIKTIKLAIELSKSNFCAALNTNARSTIKNKTGKFAALHTTKQWMSVFAKQYDQTAF